MEDATLRQGDKLYDQAYKMYRKGVTMALISRDLEISASTVRSWKNRDGWKRRKGAPKGNRNAQGNDGGSGRPAKHGIWSKYFTEETRDIYENLVSADPLELLWHNIIFLQAEILRSQAIMNVADQEDIDKDIIADGDNGTQYKVMHAHEKQAAYLASIARAQGEIRQMVKAYLELEGKSTNEAKEQVNDWRAAIIAIAQRRKAAMDEKDDG